MNALDIALAEEPRRIVSVDLAKKHMNVVGNDDDELIELYIDAAQAWISNYIGQNVGWCYPLCTLPDIKLAVLKLTAFYYEQREAVGFGATMQIAPYGVRALVEPYRESWFGEHGC